MARTTQQSSQAIASEFVFNPWWRVDPALALILEIGDQQQQRAGITAGIQMQREILQAQITYLNAIQGIVNRGGQQT